MAEIENTIFRTVDFLKGFLRELISEISHYYYLSAIVLLLLIIILMIKVFSSKAKQRKRYISIYDTILNHLKPDMNLKSFFEKILMLYCSVISAESYGFYVLDVKSESYMLKAIKHKATDLVELGPSYSGLATYKKESYMQPVMIKKSDISGKTEISKEGLVPVLTLPFEGGEAIIRIAPVKRASKKRLELLRFINLKVKTAFDIVYDNEMIKSRIESIMAANAAMNGIVKAFSNSDGLLFTMLGLIIKQSMADGGFFLRKRENSLKAYMFTNIGEDFVKELSNDQKTMGSLLKIPKGREISSIGDEEPEFYLLPPYFFIEGFKGLLFLSVVHEEEQILAVVAFKDASKIHDMDEDKMNVVKFILSEIKDTFDSQADMDRLTLTYQHMLGGMMKLIDNLNPYTIGYSELMARFSFAIASEMNVGQEEKADIYVAAFLSNIGVLGLSNDIFYKQGKFTDMEYNEMKLHSEAGAVIIENTLRNKRAADYVRYHHERMDGLGYPAGLKADEIPIGSKIISVVQFFLAKISSRNGRPPLSFDEALASLKNVAGSQLDSNVVDALYTWFMKKRRETESGCSLSQCWVMRCCPEELYTNCPAYGNDDCRCWDYRNQGIKCSGHGNECNTCFIRTEVLDRDELFGTVKQKTKI